MGLCNPDDVSESERDTDEGSAHAPPYSPLLCTDHELSSDESTIVSHSKQSNIHTVKDNVQQVCNDLINIHFSMAFYRFTTVWTLMCMGTKLLVIILTRLYGHDTRDKTNYTTLPSGICCKG